MQLVDKQDDPPVALLDFVEHGLEPLFKLAAVLGSRNQRAHIQREHLSVFQVVRHVPAYDSQREPFRDCGLADARLADENGVVLRFTREDADDAADFLVPPDDRVELLILRQLNKVLAVFGQNVISALGAVRTHLAAAANGFELLGKRLFGDAVFREQLLDRLRGLFDQAKEQVLNRDILIAHLFCLFLRLVERVVQALGYL